MLVILLSGTGTGKASSYNEFTAPEYLSCPVYL
jgi:hypothetical protein